MILSTRIANRTPGAEIDGELFECFYEKVVKSQGRRGGHP